MNPRTKKLRELLARPGILRSLGIHDAFTALVAQEAGLELLFLGGFGASASMLGLPDLNFITQTEMADAIRRISGVLKVPLIADGDTGHGDLHQVRRTVELFEAAGAAGIILEDQTFPKRCGHFDRKQVIPAEEMVLKFRAAASARKDPDFLIVARTDARQMNGLEDAIDRINRYCESGAEVAFIEAPQSVEELEEIPKRVPHTLFVNMLTGGVTPILSAEELEGLGYKIVVSPVETLMVTAKAVRDLCVAFLEEGRADRHCEGRVTFGELKELLGVERYLAQSRGSGS
jgi:methylisocitrate lyase